MSNAVKPSLKAPWDGPERPKPRGSRQKSGRPAMRLPVCLIHTGSFYVFLRHLYIMKEHPGADSRQKLAGVIDRAD